MKTKAHLSVFFFLLAAVVFYSCKKESRPSSAEALSKVSVAADSWVNTPFGKVRASEVFEDDPGTIVSVINGRVVETDALTGKVVKDFGVYSGEKKPVIQSANQSKLKLFSTTGTGYYCSANLPAGDTVKTFKTTWVVPVKPTSDSVQFIWNGLDGGSLQPVLMWNEVGTHIWQISNWYYLNGYHHGAFITVQPGTSLTGVITLTSHTATSYTYTESFTGYSSGDVTIVRPTLANSTVEDLEAYTNSYLDYPNQSKVQMKNINCLTTNNTHPTLPWTVGSGTVLTPSGKETVVVSNSGTNGEIDFYFR